MANVVTFSYLGWVAQFPEFSCVNEATAQGYFDLATLYLRNDGCGPVKSDAVQAQLLNLLTAHLAQLLYTAAGTQPTQLVGRISNATEGSVSVGVELANMPPTAAWFTQTKYGLAFWQATAAFRTMRYFPNPTRVPAPLPFSGGGGVGAWTWWGNA